jgi:hypothetical protein
MTPHDRLRVSIATARYLEALERDDHATLDAIWEQAAADDELLTALQELHAGLIEEQEQAEAAALTGRVAAAAEQHLTSGDVARPLTGPATVSDAAEELFRGPPARLSGEAHQLNERLRASVDVIPADLGLSEFVTWAEAKYGPASAAYWKALREAAIKLDLRRSAEADYQLAARRAAKPEGGPR